MKKNENNLRKVWKVQKTAVSLHQEIKQKTFTAKFTQNHENIKQFKNAVSRSNGNHGRN